MILIDVLIDSALIDALIDSSIDSSIVNMNANGNDGDVESKEQSAQCGSGRQKYHIAKIDIGLHTKAFRCRSESTILASAFLVFPVTRNPLPSGTCRTFSQLRVVSFLDTILPASFHFPQRWCQNANNESTTVIGTFTAGSPRVLSHHPSPKPLDIPHCLVNQAVNRHFCDRQALRGPLHLRKP